VRKLFIYTYKMLVLSKIIGYKLTTIFTPYNGAPRTLIDF